MPQIEHEKIPTISPTKSDKIPPSAAMPLAKEPEVPAPKISTPPICQDDDGDDVTEVVIASSESDEENSIQSIHSSPTSTTQPSEKSQDDDRIDEADSDIEGKVIEIRSESRSQ